MYQGGLFGKIQVVPVLVVDSISSGVYDTVIPDLSTSWQDYTRDDSSSNKKIQIMILILLMKLLLF